MIIGQNLLGKMKKPSETTGNTIIGMRHQSLIKEEPIWHKIIIFKCHYLISRKYYHMSLESSIQ